MKQTTPISIRTAAPADATDITALYLQSRKQLLAFAPLVHSDQAIGNWISSYLIPEGNIRVAVSGQQIVGMCATSADEVAGWIDQLYQSPQYIRRGTGSALLGDALKRPRRPVRLYSFEPNYPAGEFYRRFGFKAVHHRDGAENEERVADVLYEPDERAQASTAD